MNLTDVIESLVEERGLARESVIEAVCDGVLTAYSKKFPYLNLVVEFNKKLGSPIVLAQKTVASTVEDEDVEISLRKAKGINPDAKVGDVINVPLEDGIGRIEILAAKQIITSKIRELEQQAVVDEFKDKLNTIIVGTAYKKEKGGIAVKIGDVTAFLPMEGQFTDEGLRIGLPVRALLKEVLLIPRNGYQLILDRYSVEFVKKLLSLEIPEIYEGIVEIKKIVRIPGYKTKIIVSSNSTDIDPVGTCVGVEGVRIKPIIKELGGEKIDLIEWSDSLETLVKNSLKPAEIEKVEIIDGKEAMIWLATDQRSLAIGKMGRNIALASQLTGIAIKLQEAANESGSKMSIPDDHMDNN